MCSGMNEIGMTQVISSNNFTVAYGPSKTDSKRKCVIFILFNNLLSGVLTITL
jgi:hypothetical protein